MGMSVISANSQLLRNIKTKMKIKENKSEMISMIPEENTSVMASMSETTRVTIAPTGFLSKYDMRNRKK